MSQPTTEPRPHPSGNPPQFGLADQARFQARDRKNNRVLWGIFAILIVLTIGVFVVLPRYVQAVDPATTSVTVITPAAAGSTPLALSPFEEAQRMRQRQAAQATLATLLELQAELEAASVQQWGNAEFEAALEQARNGDASYRNQDFVAADSSYQAGLVLLQQLDASKSEVYRQHLAVGAAALTAGKAAEANAAYAIALLIRPDSSEATTGLARAKVLDEVLGLLEAGHNLQAEGQLEAARDQFLQAQSLDAANTAAPQALTAVNQAITARDFAAAMSRGYAALQRGAADAARTAFNQAAKLRPGSDEVAAALQQAADQETFTAVSVHINTAQSLEAEEKWRDALAAWQQALNVDGNLVSALEGLRRSTSRDNLDTYLEGLIAQPLTLAEDSVSTQARQVLSDAARITTPGPRLQRQLQQVAHLLDLAQVPAEVHLQSDGQTAVTVYRVGELGNFSTHTLSLLPGNYVAVGVRAGYRDVRQEFVVPLGGDAPVVIVSCTERI